MQHAAFWTLMALGAGLDGVQTGETDPSSSLVWDSEPLARDLDGIGGVEVQLNAVSTAADHAGEVTAQGRATREARIRTEPHPTPFYPLGRIKRVKCALTGCI